MRFLFSKLYLIATSSILISGCALHTTNFSPNPNIEAYQSFSIEVVDQSNFSSPWWSAFDRPVLDDLIDNALSNNYDIAQSVAVLNQSRALARQTSADRFPQIDISGDADKNWRGSDGQRGTSEIGADLSWELDIWQRISSATQADKYDAVARFEDVEILKLLISTETANAYFGAVASNQTIRLLKQQLKLDRELQNLLSLRLKEGLGTNVEVLQQRARVADAQKRIPLAESDLTIFENRLDVLIGKMPDGKANIPTSDNLKFIDKMPALNIPAALLLNRPDLRSARAELIAADADIASAIADRLPRVTLDGSYAFSDAASFTGPVSMVMGTFVQPLLDWGKRKAEVARNKALYEEKLAAYTGLYLEAVEQVENALTREMKQREFLKQLNRQRQILQQTVNAAKDRYTSGVDDYLPVIDALKELHNVQRDLVTENLNLINIRIDLYRAIGAPTTKDIPDEAV